MFLVDLVIPVLLVATFLCGHGVLMVTCNGGSGSMRSGSRTVCARMISREELVSSGKEVACTNDAGYCCCY